MGKKLNVIVMCYKFKEYITECIDSILSQQINFEMEILVRDDGTNDGTYELLTEKYYNNKNVKVLESSKNLGAFENYKSMYNLCDGEYICYIDGDDYFVDPNYFQRAVDFLDINKNYVMYSTGYRYNDDSMPLGTFRISNKDDVILQDLFETNHISFGRIHRNIKNIFKNWMLSIIYIDWAINCELLQYGKAKCERCFSGIYRLTGLGMNTKYDESQKKEIHDNTKNILIMKYSQKKSLKLLYITPHLSTGGGPQYLLKKIQLLNNQYEIYCVEYSNITGGQLIVQRSQILDLLGNKLITLGEDKFTLISHIHQINPDVIHFEEMPEFFCDTNLAKKIYSEGRTYKIIETSHDSSFDPKNKLFFPDRFALISEYQRRIFSCLNVPITIVEYPIEYKQKKDRNQSLIDLGLDPNKTHFLNVGLFTPRKNQAEIIKYAKELLNENVQFHFVGNQADNFKSYWDPLMKDFPSNCKWWGERKDVDTFYNAMDVFLFTSKGTIHDKETSPLVLRESIGWNLPILMYNLPVYCGMYDNFNNINYLNNDFDENLKLIKSKILNNKSSSTDFDSIFDVNFELEENKFTFFYKKYENNFYYIVFKDIDSNAPMYYFSGNFEQYVSMWSIPIPKHVYSFKDQNSFRGVKIELYDLQKNIICYKNILMKDVPKTRNVRLDIVDPFDCLFNNYNEMFVHNSYDTFKFERYTDVILDVGANSGLFTKMLVDKGVKKVFSIEPNPKCLKNLRSLTKKYDNVVVIDKALADKNKKTKFFITHDNSTLGSFYKRFINEHSNVEELEVECITLDDIINKYNLSKISMLKLDVESAEYDILYSLSESTFAKIDSILLEYHDNTDKRIVTLVKHLEKFGFSIFNVQNQTDTNKNSLIESYENVVNATMFLTKNKTSLKIKLVHLQTNLNDDREVASRKSLEPLKDVGIDYVLHTNELYKSLPPIHTSKRPTDVSIEKINSDSLTSAHYGCFESFKLGILSEFDDDLDYLILCEGDCLLETNSHNFIKTIETLDPLLKKENIDYFSFGDTKALDTGILQSNLIYKPENQDICYVTDKIIGLQCIMFSKKIKKVLFEYLRTAKWDAADIYFNIFCWEKGVKSGILYNRLTTQCDGYSFLDKTYKTFTKNESKK
jgi:FkbM family methyltransferase